jgi:hypothetical protein
MTNPGVKALLFGAVMVGCAADEDSLRIDETAQAVTCPVPAINVNRSLAVRDPTILANFSFQRVMRQINTSAKGSTSALATYQQWMSTWADCVDPNGYGIRCPRIETKFGKFNPFATTGPRFVPVALMNRFDLAPTSGADCGEYRVVYALLNSPGDRGFIIFEARLPNPDTAAGLAGCSGVANFWAQLSNDTDVASRATKLERFYFTGITADGHTYEPVISGTHYGLTATGGSTGKGQIRTNFFAQFQEWHLREFKLHKGCALTASCAMSFKQVTVKTNPANELFAGTHMNAPAFQAAFLAQVPALSSTDAATIGMTVASKFDEMESSSQVPNVVYRGQATAAFKTQIAGAITNPILTADNILDRATTQTCGGCHQLSNGVNLGGGVIWPQSGGFVHIDENRTMSPALVSVFLPRRSAVLSSFLDSFCSGATPQDNGLTLSGAPLDSPN